MVGGEDHVRNVEFADFGGEFAAQEAGTVFYLEQLRFGSFSDGVAAADDEVLDGDGGLFFGGLVVCEGVVGGGCGFVDYFERRGGELGGDWLDWSSGSPRG